MATGVLQVEVIRKLINRLDGGLVQLIETAVLGKRLLSCRFVGIPVLQAGRV